MAKRKRSFRSLLIDSIKVPGENGRFLPRGFQRIGSIVILNLRPEVSCFAKEIAKTVLKNYPYIKTVCTTKGISGEYREPGVKWLAGEKTTETTHTENRCRFRLDVTKVMLSKGNLSERARVPRIVKQGETIVDMFAGIGYFSIPIAKHASPKRIYAIEKNPASFRYLRENIRLNSVQDVITPIMGDCREVRMGDVADRILMGYLPRTDRFLNAAFEMLKPEGGIMHYHDTFAEDELWEKPLNVLERAAFKGGYKLNNAIYKAVVKEYAPRIYHVVIDAEFGRL